MGSQTQFRTGTTRIRAFLKVAGMAVLAAFLCIGCGDKSTGGGGNEKGTSYIITFDAKGGTVAYTIDTTGKNGKLASLPTPEYEGYAFDGWYTAETGGTTVDTSTVFTKNTTIYAQWTLNTNVDGGKKITSYLITFNPNGGTVAYTSDTTRANGKLASLPTPTKDGHEFDDWYTAETGGTKVDTGTVFDKDTTIYARWTINEHKVTFDSRGGSAVESQLIEHGGTVNEPDYPTHPEGQNFAGWYTDSTSWTGEWDFAAAVTAPITLYARWTTLPVHDVTFNTLISGATHTTQQVIEGDTVIFSAATRTGYTLEGWYTDSDLTDKYDFAAPVTASIMLYAKWTINRYTVKFVDDDGTTVLKQETVNHGSGATAPTLTARTGYTSKWDKTFSSVTENLTVTAVYDINRYTVKFVDYDGTTVLKEEPVNHGSGATAPTSPMRIGYTFKNWDKTFSAVTENLTVTAVYDINQYTVTFNSQGGSAVDPQTVDYNTKATAPTPTPTFESENAEHYTLSGWYKEPTYTTAWNFATDPVTASITLYAKWTWTGDTYEITFNVNGGDALETTSGTTGADYQLASLPTPTRDGLTFKGWFTAATGGDEVTKDTPFDADAIIYAQWGYTITFNANYDGGTVSPASAITGTDFKLTSLPTLTRSGYTFNGWFTAATDGEAVTTSTEFGTAATIYAQWTLITYTITFDANDGTVSPASATTGDGWTLASLPTPTRSGYLFSGWFTAASGGEAVTVNRVYSTNAVIYAQWRFAFIDDRDNKEYRKTTIGTQTWMAENLNYNASGSVCYNNSADSCAKYGRLYNWATAMNIDASYNNSFWNGSDVKHQGTCPVGWHIPSDAEWTTLTVFVGDDETVATKLKAKSGWDYGNGTDDYGFSALPGGMGTGRGFIAVGSVGYWWSATEGEVAFSCVERKTSTNFSWGGADKNGWESVRCVQD